MCGTLRWTSRCMRLRTKPPSKDMVKNNFPDCLRRSILTTEDVPD